MKTLLIPANDQIVIRDPATGKRVTHDGVRVDARSPFWHRRLRERSMMIAPEAAPVIASPAQPPPADRAPTANLED